MDLHQTVTRFKFTGLGVGIFVFVAITLSLSTGSAQSGRIDGFGIGSSAHLRVNPDDLDRTLNEQKTLGVRWTREEIPWSEVEETRDEFQWDYGSRNFFVLLDELEQRQINMLALLGYGPLWLQNAPPDELVERWGVYVQAVVDQFGDRIDYWEIGNEMNSRKFWGKVIYPGVKDALAEPDPYLYARMLQVAYDIIKTHDPNDVVILGGLVTITDRDCPTNPFVYLSQVHAAGAWNSFDAIAFHPYWDAYPPEAYTDRGKAHDPNTGACIEGEERMDNMIGEVRALRQLVDNFGAKPIWITEIGWNLPWLKILAGYRGTHPDLVEADYVVRTYVPLLSEPGVEKVFWYTQIETTEISDQHNCLLDPPGKRALGNLAYFLTGSTPLGQFQGQDDRGRAEDDDVYEYRFEKDGRLIIVLWKARGGDVKREVIVRDLAVDALRGYPADSAELSPQAGVLYTVKDKSVKLLLTERPKILVEERIPFWDRLLVDIQAWLEARGEDQGEGLERWWAGIQKQIDDWAAEQQEKLSQQFEAWLQNLVRQLAQEAEEQLQAWVDQLCMGMMLPVGGVVWWALWRRRKTRA